MNKTLDNVKSILEDELGFKTITTETTSEKNTLFLVAIKFTKTKLQMLHISDVNSDDVVITFDRINKIGSLIKYDPERFKKITLEAMKLNNDLKIGNFLVKVDDEEEPSKIFLSYRVPISYENELSENLYKRVIYVALKTISQHAPKLLDV